MKLLIIRPQPGGDATAKRAKTLGIETTVIPLFEVRSVAWVMPANQTYDAVMITSANALVHGGAELRQLGDLPVLAVGASTAKRARAIGLDVTVTGELGVGALLETAAGQNFKSILWLTGAEHIAVNAPVTLNVDCIVVYEAHSLPPPATLATALRSPMITALHSPRAACVFSEMCNDLGIDKSRQSLAVFSPAIAKAAGLGWRCIAVAAHPNDAALLSVALTAFTKLISDP